LDNREKSGKIRFRAKHKTQSSNCMCL